MGDFSIKTEPRTYGTSFLAPKTEPQTYWTSKNRTNLQTEPGSFQVYWELLTMLNPHFVAGEHGLFGNHKSEDIGTFFKWINFFYNLFIVFSIKSQFGYFFISMIFYIIKAYSPLSFSVLFINNPMQAM